MSWGGERHVLALRILAERRRSGNDFPTTQRQRLAVVNCFIETKGSSYLFFLNERLIPGMQLRRNGCD